jgi:hypothetical protein
MQKSPLPVLAAFAAATLIAGCASAEKSRVWQTVKAVRHFGPFEKSPPAAYAARLHKTRTKEWTEPELKPSAPKRTTGDKPKPVAN